MTELQVLDRVRRALIESLEPLQAFRHRDIWTTCRLREDLYATEPEDYADIVFRLNRYLELGLGDDEQKALAIAMESLETVAELNTLVYRRFGAVAHA